MCVYVYIYIYIYIYTYLLIKVLAGDVVKAPLVADRVEAVAFRIL